ncbi:MAG: hypothetical protein AB2A00_19865 [Myxococcota bacterium]
MDEVEPNDLIENATPMPNDNSATGEINPANDFDFFSFTATEGDYVVVSTTATTGTCGSPSNDTGLDTYLTIYASDGTPLMQNDNMSVDDWCGGIGPVGPLVADTYYAEVTSFVGTEGLYTLILAPGTVSETEPNETAAEADAYADNWVSAMYPETDSDFVSFVVTSANSSATIETTAINGVCTDGWTDTYLLLLDSNDNEIDSNDDIDLNGGNYCSRMMPTGLAVGTYNVQVLSIAGSYPYGLTITITP